MLKATVLTPPLTSEGILGISLLMCKMGNNNVEMIISTLRLLSRLNELPQVPCSEQHLDHRKLSLRDIIMYKRFSMPTAHGQAK